MNGKRILVVDDNRLLLDVLTSGIKACCRDYAVTTAASGAEALDKLQAEAFDLILTDYELPGMNGLELAQAARRISPRTAVVLMTSRYYSAEIEDSAAALKLEGFLLKPFSLEQIREILYQ